MPGFLERILLLPCALLALSISHALANTTEARSTTVPAPIAISPDGNWEGIDGTWSSFNIQIGTPPQDVSTFLSWSCYQTWAVISQGCGHAGNYSACATTRGGIFNEGASSTFEKKGTYDLYVGRPLGLYGNAVYGFDKVGLPEVDGNELTLNDTLVGGFALEDFYLGIFGINPKPTNFSSFSNGSPSYMTLLKEKNYIPSVSFGYSAGAIYRSDSAFASLTLGGYDESKLIKNDLTWTLAPDNSRDVVVAINSINTQATDPSNPVATELLPSPIYAYMDALVAEIWLPLESCQVFESVFGLQYDNTSELYLVNSTHHQTLLDRNASITFQLGITTTSEKTISIELPYAAFDLTARVPYQYIQNDSYYFPLRRAANETQYWIGRTFFQEAYIAIDYERAQFNVSQRDWDASAPTQLVAIPAYTPGTEDAGSGSNGGSSSGLSSGAIAGIVVGAVAVIALLTLLLIWLFRRPSVATRRPAKHKKLDSDAGSANNEVSPGPRGQEPNVFPKAELEGSAPAPAEEPPTLGSGALFSDSDSGSGTPRTPHALSGATFIGPRGLSALSASNSPTTDSPEPGTGTQSSTDSSSGTRNTGSGTGSGTLMSLVSPISPGSASEADSQERRLYEMPGDMPSVREKDGRELSEKEALAHREKVYNGVDSSSAESPVDPYRPASAGSVPNFSRSSLQGPRRINPEDVTTTNQVLGLEYEPRDFTRHRAFSFEEERSAGNTGELHPS